MRRAKTCLLKDITDQETSHGTRTTRAAGVEKHSFFLMGEERKYVTYSRDVTETIRYMMLLDTGCSRSVMPWESLHSFN